MRPIDADALVIKLPDDLPYKASVKRVLLQAPTLDVVPREEVAKIFEEIEKALDALDHRHMLCGNPKQSWGVRSAMTEIAEIKKKYTEIDTVLQRKKEY